VKHDAGQIERERERGGRERERERERGDTERSESGEDNFLVLFYTFMLSLTQARLSINELVER
jgi:hypothetical protein